MAFSAPSSHGASEGSQEYVEGRLLDGFLLLAAGGSSAPDDVVSVNLSSLQIVDVSKDDLAFFVHLDKLDVSDNQLSYEQVLEQFGQLPRLHKLYISCNSISCLQVPPNVLTSLHVLDLSFNELHGDVLAQLANLPRLKTLNLASNCISSVPPESDLVGLEDLEELNLDSNDLVQFVQWRALVALPRLKKLSLSSNRVKRLKDDAPEEACANYFPALQELVLSQNEIPSIESLPVIEFFRALRVLDLSDNPCTKIVAATGGTGHKFIGTEIKACESKAWYLHGSSGSFMKRVPAKEPKLKIDRKRMRRIKHTPINHRGTRGQRSCPQLGSFVEEADRLLLSMSLSRAGSPSDDTFVTSDSQGATAPRELQLDTAPSRSASTPCLAGAATISRDPTPRSAGPTAKSDTFLTGAEEEEDFDRVLLQRRRKIDRAFDTLVVEPSSFMRRPPFEVTASAGKRLGFARAVEEPRPTVARSHSSVTLQGASDDRSDATRLLASGRPPLMGGSPASSSSPQLLSLPAIRPDSQGSSARGMSRSGSLDRLIKEGGRPKPRMDVGVKEAMRALRAAAMADVPNKNAPRDSPRF